MIKLLISKHGQSRSLKSVGQTCGKSGHVVGASVVVVAVVVVVVVLFKQKYFKFAKSNGNKKNFLQIRKYIFWLYNETFEHRLKFYSNKYFQYVPFPNNSNLFWPDSPNDLTLELEGIGVWVWTVRKFLKSFRSF